VRCECDQTGALKNAAVFGVSSKQALCNSSIKNIKNIGVLQSGRERRSLAISAAKLCLMLFNSLEVCLKLFNAVKPNLLRHVVSEAQLYIPFKWLKQLQILRAFVFITALDHLEEYGRGLLEELEGLACKFERWSVLGTFLTVTPSSETVSSGFLRVTKSSLSLYIRSSPEKESGVLIGSFFLSSISVHCP
jgi:hypothetical protein